MEVTMQKCRYADEYKALFRPRCNAGKGCTLCNEKWQANLLAGIRDEQKQAAKSNGKHK